MRVLRPPPLLLSLVAEGRWRQPSDANWAVAVPWLIGPEDALDLVPSSRFAGAKVYTGFHKDVIDPAFWSTCSPENGPQHVDDLRQVDASRAIIIAENRIPGSDVAVALDLRVRQEDPRVVASEWVVDPADGTRHIWREASPRLSEFVAKLGL